MDDKEKLEHDGRLFLILGLSMTVAGGVGTTANMRTVAQIPEPLVWYLLSIIIGLIFIIGYFSIKENLK